jgi:hypothetical protein
MGHLHPQSEGFDKLVPQRVQVAHDKVTAEIVQLLSGTDGIGKVTVEQLT